MSGMKDQDYSSLPSANPTGPCDNDGPISTFTADAAARYAKAATPANTTAAYSQAVDHYRIAWGGVLPASELSIVRFLAEHATKLAVSTLKLRLAGLAHWHRENGFTDPTKGPEVKKVMKGIARTHSRPPRQANSLPFEYLQKMVLTLDTHILEARGNDDRASLLRHLRNRALLLLGFWRGFRSDELTRVCAEHIRVFRGERMEIFLAHSKTDSDADGTIFKTPALRILCPVEAYIDWISESDIRSGPVFRKIDLWGNVSGKGIYSKSLGPLLNGMAKDSGLDIHLSTHSMRHGFANWAADAGWDVRSIMEHVGWTNYDNAARYLPKKYDYGVLAVGGGLTSSVSSSLPSKQDEGCVLTVTDFNGET